MFLRHIDCAAIIATAESVRADLHHDDKLDAYVCPCTRSKFRAVDADRRADLPISEKRGSAEDANGEPDVRESSTPSARAMALDAQRRRLQQRLLWGLEFQKDGKRAVVLFRELSKASGSGNFDDQARKQVRKKTELDQRIRHMIEFLDGDANQTHAENQRPRRGSAISGPYRVRSYR